MFQFTLLSVLHETYHRLYVQKYAWSTVKVVTTTLTPVGDTDPLTRRGTNHLGGTSESVSVSQTTDLRNEESEDYYWLVVPWTTYNCGRGWGVPRGSTISVLSVGGGAHKWRRCRSRVTGETGEIRVLLRGDGCSQPEDKRHLFMVKVSLVKTSYLGRVTTGVTREGSRGVVGSEWGGGDRDRHQSWVSKKNNKKCKNYRVPNSNFLTLLRTSLPFQCLSVHVYLSPLLRGCTPSPRGQKGRETKMLCPKGQGRGSRKDNRDS